MVILSVLFRSGWFRVLLLLLPLPLLGLGWVGLGFRFWVRAGGRTEGVGLEGEWGRRGRVRN